MKNRFFKKKVSNFINFSEDYIEYLYHILKNLNKKNIKKFENLLEVARKKNKQFLLLGMVELQRPQ